MTSRIFFDGAGGPVAAFAVQRIGAAFDEADMSSAVEGADEHQIVATRDNVRSADVVITFIGEDWIDDLQDSTGLRRLLLTEAVLAGVPVAPVLVNDAQLPDVALLPDELRNLLDGKLHRIKVGSTVFHSIDELIDSLASRLENSSPGGPDRGSVAASEGDQLPSERADLVASVDAGWRRAAELAETLRREREEAASDRNRRLPGSGGPITGGSRDGGPSAPAMGQPPPTAGGPTRADEAVRLGVSAPKRVRPDQGFVARLVAYPADQAAYARKLLRGPRRRSTPRLDVARCRWPDGAEIEVRVSGEHLVANPPTRVFVWRGDPIEAAFDVVVSSAADPRTVVLTYEVVVNGIPLAHPHLEVDVAGSVRRRLGRLATLGSRREARAVDMPVPTSAFASYSSKDRNRVLDSVLALEAIGVDVFADCLDIKAGEEFKPRIERELLDRDLYVLFWSDNARDSVWVMWELETVLDQRGEEPIRVNALEPNLVPPARLQHLNFGSPGTMIAAYSRSTSPDTE